MSLFDGYIQQLQQILGVPFQNGGFHLSVRWDSVEEARDRLVRLRLMQKELRMLKKEVSAHKRELRSEYVNQRQSVGLGVGSAVLRGFFGARTAGRANQAERRSIRSAQQSAMQPFERLVSSIDQMALGLDRIKLRLDRCISTGIVDSEEDEVDSAEPPPLARKNNGGWIALLILGLVIGIPVWMFRDRNEAGTSRDAAVAAPKPAVTLPRASPPQLAESSPAIPRISSTEAAPATPIPAATVGTTPTTTAEAQRLALQRYPDLGRAGSAFNAEFLRRHNQLKTTNPAYLKDPAWPLKLADEVARNERVPAR